MQKLIDIGYQLEDSLYIFKEIRKNRPDRNRSEIYHAYCSCFF